MHEEEKVIWKIYPEFDFIEVNQFGEIRTKDRIVRGKDGNKYHIKGRVLTQQLNNRGYMYVQFRANGKYVKRLVHRIVAICFIPNPNGWPEVNHIDNDPTNNAVSNLEWCSDQYNQDYKKNFGTSPAQIQAIPVIAVNLETSEIFWFESQSEAARQLGADVRIVNSVVKGKSHKTHGFWFCNADKKAVEKTREKFGDEIAKKVKRLMNEHNN